MLPNLHILMSQCNAKCLIPLTPRQKPCRNSDHAASRVKAACQRSLKALRLDYLDLYLIHWPVTGIPGPELAPSLEETWAAMEQLVRDGLVKAIGVSNFSVAKLRRLLKCATIKPAVVQVGS